MAKRERGKFWCLLAFNSSVVFASRGNLKLRVWKSDDSDESDEMEFWVY